MTRSAEALERRAKKRCRTVEEQQAAEVEAAKKAKQSIEEKGRQEVLPVQVPVIPNDPLSEPGAWKCPACGNHNFASRYICNSKTCNEAKPESTIRPGGQQQAPFHHGRSQEGGQRGTSGTSRKTTTTKTTTTDRSLNRNPRRHDPETSKFIDWTKPQASKSLIEQNQLLRQRLRIGDHTLQGEELERAKLLVARDERKQQKKAAQKKNKAKTEKPNSVDKTNTIKDKRDAASETDAHETDKNNALRLKLLAMREQQKANKQLLKKLQETKGEGLTESEKIKALEIQARKKNKLLMKTFEKTGGKGMSQEDATRAKRLIERKARKHEQRLLNGKGKAS